MDELREALLKFRNDRDWEQFHNAKDLALALNVEAGELLELFLWKDAQQANPEKVKDILGDIANISRLFIEFKRIRTNKERPRFFFIKQK
jgi:NTP pyrophosphatase (non-canonical NTP hydrolase)